MVEFLQAKTSQCSVSAWLPDIFSVILGKFWIFFAMICSKKS